MNPSSSRALENSSQSRELAQRGLELVDCTRGRIGDSDIEKFAMLALDLTRVEVDLGEGDSPWPSSCSLVM